MAVRIFRFMWNGMLRAGEQRGVPRVHPTQKPAELMRWCINHAQESIYGDKRFDGGPWINTILDPFMGSGTTLRACKDLGRKGIGIEIEEKYVAIAIARLKQEVLPLDYVPKQIVSVPSLLLDQMENSQSPSKNKKL